jgi:hypothetical protein
MFIVSSDALRELVTKSTQELGASGPANRHGDTPDFPTRCTIRSQLRRGATGASLSRRQSAFGMGAAVLGFAASLVSMECFTDLTVVVTRHF